MEYYNKYIDSNYKSEIVIVNLKKDTILTKKLFYIQFKHNLLPDGFYNITNELKNIFLDKKRKTGTQNEHIYDLTISTRHYCYINVLYDKQNPQLVGKVLKFRIQQELLNMCGKFTSGEEIIYSKPINLVTDNIKYTNGRNYISYNKSNNSTKNMVINDYTLINKEDFKTISLIKESRKQKLDSLEI